MLTTILLYVGVTFGIPVFVATAIWCVPNLFLVTTVGRKFPLLFDIQDSGFIGVVASVFACQVFIWFNVNISFFIPLILAFITTLNDVSRKEMHRILPSIIGIFVGYYGYSVFVK